MHQNPSQTVWSEHIRFTTCLKNHVILPSALLFRLKSLFTSKSNDVHFLMLLLEWMNMHFYSIVFMTKNVSESLENSQACTRASSILFHTLLASLLMNPHELWQSWLKATDWIVSLVPHPESRIWASIKGNSRWKRAETPQNKHQMKTKGASYLLFGMCVPLNGVGVGGWKHMA